MNQNHQKFPPLLLSLVKTPIYIGLFVYLCTQRKSNRKKRQGNPHWISLMATAAAVSPSFSLNHHSSLVPKYHGVSLNSGIRVPTRVSSRGFNSRIRASSAVAVEPVIAKVCDFFLRHKWSLNFYYFHMLKLLNCLILIKLYDHRLMMHHMIVAALCMLIVTIF